MKTDLILSLDLGKFKSVACASPRTGGESTFCTVASTRDALLGLLGHVGPAVVVIEACATSGWDRCSGSTNAAAVCRRGGFGFRTSAPGRTAIACAGAAYLANSLPPSLKTLLGLLLPSDFNSIFRSLVGPLMVTVRLDVLMSEYFWGACHFIVSGVSDSPARMATGCVPTTQPSPETVVVRVKRPSPPMRPEAGRQPVGITWMWP